MKFSLIIRWFNNYQKGSWKLLLILMLSISSSNVVFTQNILKNPSFENHKTSTKITDWESIEAWNSSSNNSGIEKSDFYSPVDGEWIVYQNGGEENISQETDYVIKSGETYTLSIWARSIRNTAETTAEISLCGDNDLIITKNKNVNAPQLKGVAEESPNDDGANIWLDGRFRHQFNDLHMYQPISLDPIEDPWRRVEDNNYEKIERLGWAVGNIIVGDKKYIYGTFYRDRPGNFYSSIPMVKALSTSGNDYTWTKPVTILDHKETEFPWVEDPHCYFDEDTGRLWMSWGGGTCYVSELDPSDGFLIFHPEDPEFDTHTKESHSQVATWPETDDGWCGDQWSSCWMEGAALYKHNGYWYYLASYGNMNKNYTIRYGRGESPTGPFYDKYGFDMMKFDSERKVYGNTILLGEEGNQLVPGHPHIWQENEHYFLGYDYRKDLSKEHDLMGIRRLHWVNDWPTIYIPITVSFNADDYPESIGKKLTVSFRNIGDQESVLAVDLVDLKIIK